MKSISINKDRLSPFWFVSFVGPDGAMKRRSTKVPVGGGMFEGEKLNAKQAEKRALMVGMKIAEAANTEYKQHNNISVREFLLDYTRRAAHRLAEKSTQNNKYAFSLLIDWLGKRADEPLRLVTRHDAKLYMEERRSQVRASTLSREIGCFKTAFNDAVDSEIIGRNPWLNIQIPSDKGTEKQPCEAFTMEELQLLIEKLPPEWSSAVRCSFETYGQRLSDIRLLKWKQFDWEGRVVRFITAKTGRELAQPMRPSFYAWARAQYEQSGMNDEAYVHPRLVRCTSSISQEFGHLLDALGIGERRTSPGGNRAGLRTKTFHSVRRAAATLLHSAGASQQMAMKLVGHNSEAIHSVYVKPNLDQLREVAEKLPELK